MRSLLLAASIAYALSASANFAAADDPCSHTFALLQQDSACAQTVEQYWSERPHVSQKEGFVTPLFSLFDEDGRDYGDLTFMMKGIPGVSLPNLDGPVGFKFTFHFATGA